MMTEKDPAAEADTASETTVSTLESSGEQEPLLQMIRKLERWYGIDIELAGSDEAIADKKLSATFSQNQSVDDVLQSISLALDLTITETNSSKNKYQLFSQP